MMSPPSQDIENVVAHVYDTAQDTLAPKTLKPDAEDFSSEDWLSSVFQPIQCGALNTCLRSKSGGYAFRDLAVDATTSTDARLETFATVAMSPFRIVAGLLGRKTSLSTALLRDVEGFVNDGEMLAVLGKSGSGCTTLLKVLAGAAKDLQMKEGSEIMYQGVAPGMMSQEFRGQCTYTSEVDTHFPELTVWETIKFAVSSRLPQTVSKDITRREHIEHITRAVLRLFNLTSAKDTKVGNELIRGVSGGERRRVTIAESFVSFSPVQFWDNNTRGMDSATALRCVQNIEMFTRFSRGTATMSIYQASQSILDLFGKVIVLFEGRQIFFGTWSESSDYFEALGFRRPRRCTTGDFLTALTNPIEARDLVIPGWTSNVPVTSHEFAEAWRDSEQRRKVSKSIALLLAQWKSNNNHSLASLRAARRAERSGRLGSRSPYMVHLSAQLDLCLRRGLRRLANDLPVPISFVVGNIVMAIIIGTVFLNIGTTSDDISKRSVLLFYSVLVNAFMSGFEVLGIWYKRPIVEKHALHALYSPVVEAVSSMLCDMPAKLGASLGFNVTMYFMTNLNRSSEAFFTFWALSFSCLMAMSMFFRCQGSLGRTHDQIMVPIGIVIMLCITYAGFIIPVPYMKPWLSWFWRINPVAYTFEGLIINEFRDRQFKCTRFIPSGSEYTQIPPDSRSCLNTATTPGNHFIDGTYYAKAIYDYESNHLWRNFGLLWVFVSLLCAIHLWSSQKVYLPTTKRTILQRSKNTESSCMRMDVELDVALVAPDSGPVTQGLVSTGESTRGATVHWTDLSYAIPTKDGFKRLLCEVEGYVEPGTLTALMGATGAGKTTLLDVLSMRKNVGIVTGEILVNGYVPADGYERMSGYAQQADYHLATATVREALHFSADLRQHSSVALPDKLRHADEVMSQLGMDLLADAIVGTLNTEQRKRLTIGMELAAKPDLLLFLDEPTSGMDSQTAFQICSLLQRLARLGHTIMCTIHQPSASILDMFDRLLLIEQGGRTIYFGNLGTNSIDMIRYFQLQGARTCGEAENPAEWMFEVTSAKPQRDDRMNWHETWIASQHRQMLRAELAKFARDKPEVESTFRATTGEFAVPFTRQLRVLLHRTMVEYWRTPSPLYAKLLFYCGSGLVIGVSCYKSPPTIQGLQNLVFALFLLFTTLSNVMQKIVPQFSERRALFEARERSSKTFSWQAFIASSVMVEAFWQTILAVMTFAILYFLTGFQAYTDSSNQAERGGLMLLLFVVFFLFTSSLSHMLIVGIEADEAAVNVGQLLFYLMLIFCGAIMTKADLPRFWIFMYRVSPLTYFLRSMFAVGVARQPITCSDTELVTVPSSPDRSCGEYLESFVSTAGGRVVNPEAVHACKYCPLADTDQFLSMFSMAYSERWRDLAIVIAFVLVNIAACFVIYWFARVPKRNRLVQLSSG